MHKLPKKFMQFGGPEESKYSKGNLQAQGGKVSLKVRGFKTKRELLFEGSPAFHFQGHNVISSGDATMLAFAALRAVKETYNLELSFKRAMEFVAGRGIQVTRIDTPVLLQVPNGLQKSAVINAIAMAGLLANHNTSVYVGESVYFDQGAQTAALKVYDKFEEVESRRRSGWPTTDNGTKLAELARRTLRMEAVYRLKYLNRRFEGHTPEPADLNVHVLGGMLHELLDRYDLRRRLRKPLNEEQLMAIAIPRYRVYVMCWQNHYDVLKIMGGNKVEYSRARTYLKRHHSFDIDGPPPTEIDEEVELGDILSPRSFLPVPVELRGDPDLFFQLDMVAEERAIAKRAQKFSAGIAL